MQRSYASSAASNSPRCRAEKHFTALASTGESNTLSEALSVKMREALVQSSQRPRWRVKWWNSRASSYVSMGFRLFPLLLLFSLAISLKEQI